jgi:thioredoxin-like negative regulator of GroEL
MVGAFLTSVLAVFASGDAASPGLSYAEAYRSAEQDGKPLVVVVGADWCPACQNLKHSTLASMWAEGDLQEVSVAQVDKDEEPELANKLMRGETIPQIIVFTPKPQGGWQRTQMTGFQSQGTLRSLIRRAVSFRRNAS